MDATAAMAYGRRIGCRYYVYVTWGDNPGKDYLLGGARTKAHAQQIRDEQAREIRSNPFNRGRSFRVWIKAE